MDLLDTIQRLNEAYCVKRGIPVALRFLQAHVGIGKGRLGFRQIAFDLGQSSLTAA